MSEAKRALIRLWPRHSDFPEREPVFRNTPTLAQWLVSQCIDRGFGVPPGSYRDPEEIFAWMWRQIEETRQ